MARASDASRGERLGWVVDGVGLCTWSRCQSWSAALALTKLAARSHSAENATAKTIIQKENRNQKQRGQQHAQEANSDADADSEEGKGKGKCASAVSAAAAAAGLGLRGRVEGSVGLFAQRLRK